MSEHKTLAERIPERGFPSSDDALDAFIGWVEDQGITLYSAQEEAILELFSDSHVILKTPTGSGKSLVALGLHFLDFARAGRSIYTAPIKALVSEKFLQLCAAFGPEFVGMVTGDGRVNADAPILCCTAEILAKMALREGRETNVSTVVMDEFHYYGDRDRGMAWQLPLLTLPHVQFLLMSATLGDTQRIEEDLSERTGKDVAVVRSAERPVPLEFKYQTTPLDSTLQSLVSGGKSPVYAVHFTQRAATERAQALLSSKLTDDEEKAELKGVLKGVRFESPFGPTLRRYLLHGVGLHHAGLLPRYRRLVEDLSQKGLFKVICGTDTLGVGINVPIRTVLFTQLCKFDGEQTIIISRRHFKQIAGRAGRKGFDDQGYVVAQAPDWVIQNLNLADKIASGKKKKKVVRKKPPTRGYKHWTEETFRDLIELPPEELESRFTVDHSLLLALLQKAGETGGDGLEELDSLIAESHAGQRESERLRAAGQQVLAELILADVVDEEPPHRVHRELQSDFSVHHTLSLWLLDALELLDQDAPDYPLQLLELVEGILEQPRAILFAQQRREKGRVVQQLKAEGVEYEERMEILEDVSWPKPGAERMYAHFNAWRAERPWVDGDGLHPKGVVRELAETQLSFAQYVKELGLERQEGVLLRYVSQVYKTLRQNVPEVWQTESVVDVLGFLRAMLARTDDSLLRSWEALSAPVAEAEVLPPDISRELRPFRARIRNELYAIVRALAVEDFDEAAASVVPGGWEAGDFEEALIPYLDEFDRVIWDPRVRQGWRTQIELTERHLWTVRQILVDEPEDEDGASGWAIEGVVDLREDANPTGPIVQVTGIAD